MSDSWSLSGVRTSLGAERGRLLHLLVVVRSTVDVVGLLAVVRYTYKSRGRARQTPVGRSQVYSRGCRTPGRSQVYAQV